MFYSKIIYTYTTGATIFSIPFSYNKIADIKVKINNGATTNFTIDSNNVILNDLLSSGDKVEIYRDTDRASLIATFSGASGLDAADLDNVNNQLLYIMQEDQDRIDNSIENDPVDNKFDAQNKIIKNAADGVASSDVATVGQIPNIAVAGVNQLENNIDILTENFNNLEIRVDNQNIVNVKDYSTIQDAVNVSTAGNVDIPKGDFSILSNIDCRSEYKSIKGDGLTNTSIVANTGVTNIIEVDDSTDEKVSPLNINDLCLDGNNIANVIGLNKRYRHHSYTKNIHIKNCATGIYAKDTWLDDYDNVRVTNCTDGVNLVGSNHSSKFDRLSISKCSNYHLKIDNQGTAVDGNAALQFNNINIEDGVGKGIYSNSGRVVKFNDCYLGENLSQEIITAQSGTTIIDGGFHLFGYTENSYFANLSGGNVIVKNAHIGGQNYGHLQNMITGSNSKIKFEDCVLGIQTGGNANVFTGDILDYGPSKQCFAPKLGRLYTPSSYSTATYTSTITDNAQTISCTDPKTGTQILSLNSPLISGFQVGQSCFLVIVYSSNSPWNVRLLNALWNANLVLGILPSTNGVKSTAIILSGIFDSTSRTVFGIDNGNLTAGSSFTLYEVYLVDAQMGNTASIVKNIYKC